MRLMLLIGLLLLVPSVFAGENIVNDGDLDVTYVFRNVTDNSTNKTFMDLYIKIDIDNSNETYSFNLTNIEVVQNTSKKEEFDFDLKLNIEGVSDKLIFNKLESISTAVNMQCGGKNCSVAYDECANNLAIRTTEHNTCSSQIADEKNNRTLFEGLYNICNNERATKSELYSQCYNQYINPETKEGTNPLYIILGAGAIGFVIWWFNNYRKKIKPLQTREQKDLGISPYRNVTDLNDVAPTKHDFTRRGGLN